MQMLADIKTNKQKKQKTKKKKQQKNNKKKKQNKTLMLEIKLKIEIKDNGHSYERAGSSSIFDEERKSIRKYIGESGKKESIGTNTTTKKLIKHRWESYKKRKKK